MEQRKCTTKRDCRARGEDRERFLGRGRKWHQKEL